MDSIITSLIDGFDIPADVKLDILPDKYDPEMLVNAAVKPMLEQLKSPHIRKIMRLMCIELYHNEKFLHFFKDIYIGPSLMFWSQLFQKMMDQGCIKQYNPDIVANEFFNYCIYLYFEMFLLKYNESSYNALIDELISKLSDHIKFIFDMIGKKDNLEEEK